MIRQILLALSVMAIATATAVRAHSFWIEPSGNNQMVVRFAEPGDDFETSPGYLDNLSAPIAFIIATNAPVAIETEKKSDHFLLIGASPTNVACVETSFTVWHGRKPFFYARWQPAGAGAAKPLLTLDLVPTDKSGEVHAWFRGKPLGGIAATLHLPDGKEQKITADTKGFLHFKADEPGQYLLTVASYREPLAGFHVGVAYEETSHNCSLVWKQP